MPEGDTVHLACRRLQAALAGRALTRAELRVPALATTDLTGVTVREVVARGKHQLIRLDNGFTLHTHLRMDGAWRFTRAGRPWPGPDFQRRVVLANDAWTVVGLRLPVVELLPTADEGDVVGHLGPDLLGPDWDAAGAVANVRADPRTIGEALLDQRNLAGAGTFYRAEVCFLTGVHPRTPTADADVEKIVAMAHRLLQANAVDAAQVTTGDTRRGRTCWVFERVNQPCRRCGTPIRTEEYGPVGQERRSYWCPRCQPAPAGVRA